MATKPLLDLAALLAPIPGDEPAGPSLRYAGDYDEIEGLRPKPDRDAIEAGGQEGQWPQIRRAVELKLKEKSKDLQLAVWLIEALVHTAGIAGLRDGLELICGLIDQFWDGLHPLPRDGDLEFRAAPLLTLLGEKGTSWVLEVPLTKLPAIDPETQAQVPVTYNLWHSIAIEKAADKTPLSGPAEEAVAKSPNDFFINLHEDLAAAAGHLETLRDKLNDRFGDVAPGVTSLRTALEQCTGRVGNILKKRGVKLGASQDESNGQDEGRGESDDSPSVGSNGAAGGLLRTREDALARLKEVADYFRRTEPHSPVSRLIERAIHWSRMSFEQLLQELVEDDASRQRINNTLGIRQEFGDASAESYSGSSEDSG